MEQNNINNINNADSPLLEKKERSGEYLFRVLKPAGCIFVLAVMVLMLLICFTHKSDPLLDYTPPRSAEYYESDASALAAELNAHLLPFFPGASCREENGRVVISAPQSVMDGLRDTVTLHYSENLFIFRISE